MDKIITLASKDNCTGCGACKAVCPKSAIMFEPDDEGFPSPIIIEEQCIHCGLCEKTCPELCVPGFNTIKASYAAQIKDKETLKDSTSGGLFTAFAREIFRRGGIVYGCVWDENYNAIIHKAENEEEIKPIRGSKYVWSWAGDTFPEIKEYLEAGRTVMFTGLPCQVAGLKNYLRKDYDNLYLVDFFCGGAPSPYIFKQYLKTITKEIPMRELDFKFRDKEKYGVGVHISYNTVQGKKNQSYVRNPYFFLYHSKVFHRYSCYHCKYRYEPRVEDITIGDYWGIGRYHNEFDIRSGVSALLINSEKGFELFNTVKDELQLSETEVQNIANGNNLSLGDKTKEFKVPIFRDAFLAELKKNGWTSAEHRFLYNKTRLKEFVKSHIPPKVKKILKNLLRR